MILTVTPNPCVDKTVFIDTLEVGAFMRAQRYTCIPGGKGANVARAVKTLGHASTAMVVVGGHTGAHVVDMIEKDDGVPCLPVWVKSPTRTITTVLEEKLHRQTAFFEPGSHVTDVEYTEIVETFQRHVADVDVVTFNGTVSDPAIARLYRDLIPLAKAAGAITVLDSHGPEFVHGLDAVPHMVKPNIAEASELVAFELGDEAAQWRAIECFHDRGVKLVVLSRGKHGALVSDGDTKLSVTPPEINEVNPVGSGDCLLAAFAIGLAEKQPLEVMARRAVAAGTANAMCWDIGHFALETFESLCEQVRVRPL